MFRLKIIHKKRNKKHKKSHNKHSFLKKLNIITHIKRLIAIAKEIDWPTRKELARYSIAVLIISVIITAYLVGLDYMFNIIRLNIIFK